MHRLMHHRTELYSAMPHRDPETGQFVAGQHSYKDIEVASFGATVGIPAADLGGGAAFTGGEVDTFEGLQLLDYDEVVDRNEELVLLAAYHRLSPEINSTETADGSMRCAVEISASPALSEPTGQAASQADTDISGGTGDFDGVANFDDTIDIVGRPLSGTAYAPFSDGSGVGGGGSADGDQYRLDMAPAEFGRFHPRDELFLNGRTEVDNVDDSGVHLMVAGQHVYGVRESC